MSFVQSVLGGVLTALVLAWIARALSRTRADELGDGARRIRLHTGLLLALAAACLGLSATALYAALRFDGGTAAWLVGLCFGFFGLGLTTSFSRGYDVFWTGDAVNGPASYGMAPFGPRRAKLRFDDIEEAGIDAMGSFFVRNAEGEKVRWNWAYRGHEDLNMAIARARPDLFSDHGRT